MSRPYPELSYGFTEYVAGQNFIGGQFVDSASGKNEPVMSPRHAKAMGQVVWSDAADVDAAVVAAQKAQKAWAETPIKEKAEVLMTARNMMKEAAEELSWLISAENGKTYAESYAEVMKSIECLDMGISLQNMIGGEQLNVSRGVNCAVTYEPLGVVAGIVPFNFPTMVPMWMLPQALIAGNAFILKPSEQTPYGALRLAEIFKDAGLPDGILNIVNGGKEAVEALCDHKGIKALGFVGSTKVAKLVYARAAAAGKPVLALGGAKNHLTVVPDADLELTAANLVASAFGCAGQRCMAASVLLAVGDVQHIIDEMCKQAKEIKLGDGMGSIINAQSVERITNYINDAEAKGAKILVDGRGPKVEGVAGEENGYWVGPTILDNVTADIPAGCEEIFGPVLSIRRVSTLDQAIKIENESGYGNAAAIYTTSGAVAEYALSKFEAGMCAVNVGVPVPREPFSFGGWNDSKFGHGDMTGMDGFRFWTRPRKVTSKWALQSDQNWMN